VTLGRPGHEVTVATPMRRAALFSLLQNAYEGEGKAPADVAHVWLGPYAYAW
jgi:hypothetical protein